MALNYENISEQDMRREKDKARRLRQSGWWTRIVQKGVCYYCHGQVGMANLTMDHVVPLSRGGKSTKGNLLPACKECNNKKKYLLPVFLVVVGSAIKSQGFSGGLFQFISYSLGMGAVLTLLALSFALFKGGLTTYLSRALPYMGRVAGALLLVSGSYQVHYWLTKGGLLTKWT